MNRGLALFVAAVTVIGSLVLVPDDADAAGRIGRVHRAFRGKVIITQKRPPSRFRSQGAFARWLRVNRKKHLWPDKKTRKSWTFEFMAFFRRPLNDLEVNIKFYDVTEGKKFIAADNFYLRGKGETIFSSKMELEKPRFSVNRKYAMYVLSPRNVLLSSTIFWLRGKGETYSGRVTFSDDEARLK
jgi:hypothetical protein